MGFGAMYYKKNIYFKMNKRRMLDLKKKENRGVTVTVLSKTEILDVWISMFLRGFQCHYFLFYNDVRQ